MYTSHLICSVSAESLLIHLLISRGGGNVATSCVFQNPRDPKPGETVHIFTLFIMPVDVTYVNAL